MPRWIHGALLAALIGCDLSEQLEDEPCAVDKDCWPTQECARTPEEEQRELPGVCRPEGTGCVFGRQLGCGCDPADPEAQCGSTPLPVIIEYPRMTCDVVQLTCVLASEGSETP